MKINLLKYRSVIIRLPDSQIVYRILTIFVYAIFSTLCVIRVFRTCHRVSCVLSIYFGFCFCFWRYL